MIHPIIDGPNAPIPMRRDRTFGEKIGEAFGVSIGLAVFGLLAWIVFRIIWFFI